MKHSYLMTVGGGMAIAVASLAAVLWDERPVTAQQRAAAAQATAAPVAKIAEGAAPVKSVGRGAPVLWAKDYPRVGPNLWGARPNSASGRIGRPADGPDFNGLARNGAKPP